MLHKGQDQSLFVNSTISAATHGHRNCHLHLTKEENGTKGVEKLAYVTHQQMAKLGWQAAKSRVLYQRKTETG